MASVGSEWHAQHCEVKTSHQLWLSRVSGFEAMATEL